MAKNETLRRFDGANTVRTISTGNDVMWRGLSISQKIIETVPTSSVPSFTAKERQDIGLAHEIFKKRMQTMDSPADTLTLRGAMSVDEIKAAVKKMRAQLRAEKTSESSS